MSITSSIVDTLELTYKFVDFLVHDDTCLFMFNILGNIHSYLQWPEVTDWLNNRLDWLDHCNTVICTEPGMGEGGGSNITNILTAVMERCQKRDRICTVSRAKQIQISRWKRRTRKC